MLAALIAAELEFRGPLFAIEARAGAVSMSVLFALVVRKRFRM